MAQEDAKDTIDEAVVTGHLQRGSKALGIKPFAPPGYPFIHTVKDLVEELGSPADDQRNTFTARLLLLLESQPLLGKTLYEGALNRVIDAYWLDYALREHEFMPAFLANDILRMWRTFCVNYEARTDKEPPDELAKRKVKNHKLKHSRLLTCYSALIDLLAVHAHRGTVTPADATAMVSRTPAGRLELLAHTAANAGVAPLVERIITCYERFLDETDQPPGALEGRLLSGEANVLPDKSELGDGICELLSAMGTGNKFFRLLLV